MRVVSKFMTADIRIVAVKVEARKLIVEGMVKEIMPMTVEMTAADVRPFLRAMAGDARARLARRLPHLAHALERLTGERPASEPRARF